MIVEPILVNFITAIYNLWSIKTNSPKKNGPCRRMRWNPFNVKIFLKYYSFVSVK
jgi:hypothetical protein